ncbi:MAG: tol-pal system protein YbgF [Alcanivoracaceae bacterium]|nr:tol-pal system protein YbgF [Alcanivoracaceae bacterium]
MNKRLILGVILSGLWVPAWAQGLGPLSVEDRVQGSRQAAAASDEALMMLMQQLQQYEQEISMLRGQFEELRFELENMKQAERDRYLDLDSRINALSASGVLASGAPEPAPAAPPAGAATAADPEAERTAYMAARDLLYASRFDDARKAFEAYLANYPQGQFRDFSHFWLGEAWRSLDKPDRGKAMAQFRTVIERFPDSSRVPSAMYRLAMLEAESGKVEEARTVLNRVIQQFPSSSEAGYAKAMLEQLK